MRAKRLYRPLFAKSESGVTNMEKIRLGRTRLMVSRSGFGAIPIQRLDKNDAGRLLRRAYESGINFFDTSRSYTDSEEKIGLALADVWGEIILATKCKGADRQKVLEALPKG